MKKKKENKDEEGKAEEPAFPYGNTIRFFSSFEEMNEADAMEMAQLSPEQHLNHATDLIERAFQKELKEKMDKKIYFGK